MTAAFAGRVTDRALEALGRQREIRVAREVARHEFRGVDDQPRAAVLDRGEHLLGADHDDIAAEHQIGALRRDTDGVNVIGGIGDADVAVNRAALLRETRHVDDADTLAFEMRRHAEDGADRHDAGAADAGDDNAIGMVGQRNVGLGQRRPVRRRFDAFGLLELRAVHGDERRAEALQARIILVAARLVDGALAAPFGLQRLHRHAVRFHAAIAAALAHQIVDDDALERIGKRAALTAAALLGGAGLVVDQHRNARHVGQRALHGVELVAVVDSDALAATRSFPDISTARR